MGMMISGRFTGIAPQSTQHENVAQIHALQVCKPGKHVAAQSRGDVWCGKLAGQ
eukprot:SAG11_NODE_127_length_15677_cov_10.890872_10_plen_54_part_00